ncbi:MAG: hypothetical protein QXK37_00205 [Candidatus Woesearchaeota archaeon]
MQDILHSSGQLDTLPYYCIVAKRLGKFLAQKEIATKTWIPDGPTFLARGSKFKPLYINEISANRDFLELRKEKLDSVRAKLTPQEGKVWRYFLPRKLCDLFYATNGEHPGKDIERIFFDIDIGENTMQEDARKIASMLIELVQNDDKFNEVIGKYNIVPMYTGRSFHVYLLLKKPIKHELYNKHIQFSKKEPLATFTGRWAKKIGDTLKIKVKGGHEKTKGFINIDPSQTPSGKLARAPFSLHMKDAKTIDGVAVPLRPEMLKDRDILHHLCSLTPDKVIENIKKYPIPS